MEAGPGSERNTRKTKSTSSGHKDSTTFLELTHAKQEKPETHIQHCYAGVAGEIYDTRLPGTRAPHSTGKPAVKLAMDSAGRRGKEAFLGSSQPRCDRALPTRLGCNVHRCVFYSGELNRPPSCVVYFLQRPIRICFHV